MNASTLSSVAHPCAQIHDDELAVATHRLALWGEHFARLARRLAESRTPSESAELLYVASDLLTRTARATRALAGRLEVEAHHGGC